MSSTHKRRAAVRSRLSAMPDAEFIERYPIEGPSGLSTATGVSVRAVHTRRKRIEGEHGITLNASALRGGVGGHTKGRLPPDFKEALLQDVGFEAKEIIDVQVKNRVIIVGSDCHYWPGMISTAHRGLLQFCEKLNPAAVILNGDVIDGASISRWPPPGWEYQPGVEDELEAAFQRTEEIRAATPKARHIWAYGNHDARFATKLASMTKEYRGVPGFNLHDHFTDWERCWGIMVNAGLGVLPTFIKHSFKGGVHAAYNNVLHAGCHMVTGHLHAAKVSPKTNLAGTLWGVDTGMLAEPRGRQFTSYTNASPTDWRSSFAVLTFDKQGNLFQPELALTVKKGVMQFRGEYVRV